jgi:hypothetical protein
VKPALAILIAILVLVGIFFFRTRWKPDGPTSAPDFKTTEELITYLAEEARDIAKKSYGIELDYSVESIKRAEEALGKLHEEYVKTKPTSGVQGLASAFGAYVGEAIRRNDPGASWSKDHPVGGPKSYPLKWSGGDSFPMAWCHKRIVNGPEDNVWHKYSVLKDRKDH